MLGGGRGRGVAAFIRNDLLDIFLGVTQINERMAQALLLSFKPYNVITVYKTQSHKKQSDFRELAIKLISLIDNNKPTCIIGDLNFDYMNLSVKNEFRTMLEEHGFCQIVNEPTTVRGNCIDHCYISKFTSKALEIYRPYYGEHEAIRVMLVPNSAQLSKSGKTYEVFLEWFCEHRDA